MRGILGIDPGWAVTLVRLATGAIVGVAGYAKFTGGLGGVATAFERYGIPLASVAAPLIAVLELVGGVLLVLGLGTRVLGTLFACEFLVTTFWVKYRLMSWNDGRLDLMLLTAAILLLLAGPGRAAIDNRWGTSR
jgi:putative oxidoreductase